MKLQFLLRFILCLFLCAGITRVALAQNYPLSVVTTMTPPYPLRFSDYEAFQNQVLITISRNDVQDTREYRIYLSLILQNETNGNRLSSRPGVRPAEAIVLEQGQFNLTLTGADIEALQSGLRLSDFDVVGFDPANGGDQVLPEGTYSFCLTALNFNTENIPQDQQLSSGEGVSCATFPVIYYLQPQLTQPQPFNCPITVDTDTDPNLSIAWMVQSLPGGSDVQYRLYFYTVPDGTPAQADPLSIINNSALPAQIVDIDDGTNTFLLDVVAGAEPALVPGLRYVFRVQAVSGTLAFQNNGFSDPCMLEVTGDAGGGDAFGFQADYPNGGIIPFKQFPVIVHMTPYSDDYHTFDYTTEFNGGTPNPNEYTGDNNWGATSPVVGQGLQNYPADVARERACYLPVYAAPQGESATPQVLQHGNTYSWNMNGAVTRRNGAVLNGQAFSEDFQYGMPASVLQTPADNARFQVNENITFNWKTGDAPEKLFPTIPDIVRRTGSGGSATTRTFHYGPVDERWVLQIARDEEFTQIVTNATRSEALTLAAFQIDNASEAQAKQALIYKNASSGATPLTFSEGTYWWRVGWLQDPANQNSTFYQTSEVRKFCVGATADCNSTAQNQPGANTPAQTGCLADCTVQAPTDRNSVAQEVENEVVVGKFTMTIRHIEGGNPQNGYHGWGDIAIPFLNNLKIKVSFIAMRVNAEHRAYEGEFSVAKEMEGNPVEKLARTAGGWLNYALNGDLPLASEVGLANDFIVQQLPIGWDQSIDGVKVVAVIDDLKFGLTGAELTIKFGYDLPGEFAGHPLIFKADRICIHPGGFQSVFRLYLAEDLIVGDNRPENYRLVFPGTNTAPPANSNQYSFVEFDCAGFKEALLAGKTIFPRTALVPENPANAALIAGEVEGSFSARLTRDAGSYDFIANVTFNHPFQIVGLEGWGFELQNAWIDMSDKRNPTRMGFPQGYELSRLGIESTSGPAATDPRLLNTWTGFYAATIAVRMRPEFKDGQAQRIGFQIDTMLIDPSGISASIYARNILDIDDGPQSGGRIQGWRFSISELGLGIVQNTSIRGSMRGKIGLPIFRAGELLDYSMLLSVQVGANTTASYQFRTNVPANRTMHIDMWQIATATLDANSAIEFVINSNDVRLEARLNGQITFSGDMTGGGSVPGMDFAGIRYENLRFGVSSQRGGFYFDENSQFSVASPQHNTSGFPVSVGRFEPVFDTHEGTPRLGIRIVDLQLSLTSGSAQQLGAKTTIAFYAMARNFSLDHIDQLSLEWGGVQVSKIGISGDVGGGIRLAGEIEFYSENMPTGGKKDGVRGSANVALPSLGAFNLFVEFGTVKNCTECPDYNTSNQYYPYFSIDAMVRLSSGITIFPGVAIMGIGGGVWYNMAKLSENQMASGDELRNMPPRDSAVQQTTPNRRVQFSPEWGKIGFGLRALFGPPSGGVYGLIVKVEAQIDTRLGSLDYIAVGGDAYFLPEDQNNPDPNTAPITASCEFRLSNIGNNEFRFTGWLEVKLAYPRSNPVIRGVGPQNELVTATFYADRTMWHFYLGHLDPNGYDAQVNRRVGRAGLLAEIPGLRGEISTYFMVGTPIPTELPPLPEAVEIMLTGANAESRAKLGSQALGGDERQTEDRSSPDGSGVAFGAHLSLETSLNFAIFYASLKAWAGVDMMLVREPGLLCANGGNGLDGWRAKGQAYVGLDGEMGVGVDIDWLCSRCRIPILRLYAAVALKAELPNPEYFVGRVGLGYEVLGGMIKGQCNFKMELGEKCHPEAADLGGVTFIGGTNPTRNECRQTQSNISTFVNPSVSFNVNMQTSQSFVDKDGHNCQVNPKLLRCFLENANGEQVAIQSSNWNSDRTVYTLVPASELAGYSDFRFVVEIGADKQCDNGGWQPVRSQGSEVVERAESCFRTGATATNIPDQNVLFSWPLKNQRFFMTQDNGLYSFIKLKQWQSVLNQTSLYEYYFRIKTLDGTPVGGRLPAELAQVSNSIVFAMPPLETQRVYAVQLIRKSKARNNQMPGLGSVKAKFIQQNNTYSSGEYQSSSTVTTRTLPDQVLNDGEKLLYSFYFRTSQHRSTQEKYATVRLQNPQLASNGSTSWLEVEMAMTGEGWEQYDLEGYYDGANRVVEPLLDLTAPFERFAQKQEVRDKVYTPLMTRYFPSGIFSYYNFVPGSGWASQYPGQALYDLREPSPKVAFKRSSSFLYFTLGLPIGEPPLDVDEITAQVAEETLHPRPVQAPGGAGLPLSNTALVYNLKYETHKIVNEHRSRLMETYQQMLDSKLVNSSSGPAGTMLAGSATDIYNWMNQNSGSLKGDMNACSGMAYFIQHPDHNLESHSADYWSGLFNCQTPAGAFGWDSQGLITGAVQAHHRLNEAQFNSLRNSDHNNRELLRSIQPPLFQRIAVKGGTYGVQFDFNIPTPGLQNGVSIPANVARTDRDFYYADLILSAGWGLNLSSGIFQTVPTGSNGTFPTPAPTQGSNGTFPVNDPPVYQPVYQSVVNLSQFSSFFFNIP